MIRRFAKILQFRSTSARTAGNFCGVFARVLNPGKIRCGDTIEIVMST